MGLDRDNLNLVLAVAHAGGSHEHSDMRVNDHGTATLNRLASLHPWPRNLHSV